MSQNNNSEGMGFALVLAALGVAALFIFAVLAFLSLSVTVLCLIAWNKPLTIGTLSITPTDARGFVGTGLVFSFLLPCFALFCALVFNVQIVPDYWPHIILAGYTLGSLGYAWNLEEEAKAAAAAAPVMPVQTAQIAPPPRANDGAREADGPAFRYAEWDDGEALR
jgi:hypothetical protein